MMSDPEFLASEEIKMLTGEKRIRTQDEWLKARGIPHQMDGLRVIVSRQHVRDWLEGKPTARSGGLNWAAVR